MLGNWDSSKGAGTLGGQSRDPGSLDEGKSFLHPGSTVHGFLTVNSNIESLLASQCRDPNLPKLWAQNK